MATQHRIVLVRPKYPANIGAVARVAGNFGITDLHVVSPEPECQNWRANEEARKLAVAHARGIFESITESDTLEHALRGTLRSVALSRRPGRNRLPPRPYFSPVTEWCAEPGVIAWVFGNETMGLTEEETLQCSETCIIPTSAELGSMNLSHAVAVVAARIFESHPGNTADLGLANPHQRPKLLPLDAENPLALHDEKAGLYQHWNETLIAAGLTEGGNPERMMRGIRTLLEAREIRRKDVALLRGFLSRVLLRIRGP